MSIHNYIIWNGYNRNLYIIGLCNKNTMETNKKLSKRELTLRKASREYLNIRDRGGDYNDTLPLVIFPYRLGMRRILGVGCSVMSFVIPDGCIGLLIGKQINNPVSIRYRSRVGVSDIKKFGVMLCLVGGYHSVRVKANRGARRVKAYYSSIFG